MTRQRTNIHHNLSTQSTELFDLIVENIEDYAILMLNPQGVFISWNSGVEKLFGYSESELVGQPMAFVFTPEDIEAGIPQRELTRARENGFSEDKRWHLRKDSSRFWANGKLVALKNRDGVLRGFAKFMRNETEQKLWEESLTQSNRRIENILESINDGFYALDRDWRFVYINQYSEMLTNRSPQELLGKCLWEEFPEVVGSVFEQQYRRAMLEQKATIFEEFYPPLNAWFEVRAYPSPEGLSLYFHDITDRKQSEELLRRNNETFTNLVQNAPFGIYVVDAEFRLFLVSVGSQKVFSNVQPLIGRDFAEVLRTVWEEPFATEAIERFHHTLETGETYHAKNTTEQRSDIEDVESYDWKIERITLPDGRFGVVCYFYDLTERLEAEKALRESEERFRTLADNMSQLAWMADTSGYIFWYNERWYEYTGTTPNEMLGWGWRKVHHPDHLDRVAEKIQHSWDTGEIWEDTFPLRSKTGEYRWFLSRALPIRNQEGQIVRWFGTNTDIEELRQARQQAEQANNLKDEFLAMLSHELRTPLNAILGWAQILQSNKLDELQREKALNTIERSARSQNQLIDDLLDVSRIITGKLRLDMRAVDLPSVIWAAIDVARPIAETKNIFLEIQISPQTELILGDPDRLQQIVWNLISNAIKFTPQNGRVQVRLERAESHIKIIVSDTGKGIEPEFLPFVFDRFRQSDGSMTRRHGGLGLGLAIVRQLVELHGGSVSVESFGLEKGSTFTVDLPLCPARNETINQLLPEKQSVGEQIEMFDNLPDISGLRVLVVEDEPDSRDLLTLVMDSNGVKVTNAQTVAEALMIFQNCEFDIVISDIGMPDEDGFSFITKIRKLPGEQGGNIPAIALTAYARTEDRIKSLRSGYQMHITKPVDPTELITVIANLTGRIKRMMPDE